MTTIDERGLSHLKEPTLSYTPYSLVDPAQHQPLAARGRLCRAALLVSSVMVIGSLFVTKVGLDSRDAVSLASVVAKGSKKGPAPLSVKDPVEMGFPPIPCASMVNSAPLGSAPARLLCLLRARLAALGHSPEVASPLGVRPLPRVRVRAASTAAADGTAASDLSGARAPRRQPSCGARTRGTRRGPRAPGGRTSPSATARRPTPTSSPCPISSPWAPASSSTTPPPRRRATTSSSRWPAWPSRCCSSRSILLLPRD